MKNKAKLTLVGAGPGDPELITLKGAKALMEADVVLYDALANDALLEHASENTERIYVGKKPTQHRYTQDAINDLIVEKALEGKHVVRLKGGDPFIFGRGHEELEYAKSFDIETAIVPGISSSISLPELQEVPLTRRGVNESFWVMTATTKNGELSKDISIAAQSSATVVILMGMRKLPLIVQAFMSEGKGNTPVMVVQNGSLPTEKIGLGRISNIIDIVAKEELSSPAVIVIGEVVNLHPQLRNAYLKAHVAVNELGQPTRPA